MGVCFQKIGAIEDKSSDADGMPRLMEKYKIYLQEGAVSLLNLKENNLWSNWLKTVTTKAYYEDLCFKMTLANPNLNFGES